MLSCFLTFDLSFFCFFLSWSPVFLISGFLAFYFLFSFDLFAFFLSCFLAFLLSCFLLSGFLAYFVSFDLSFFLAFLLSCFLAYFVSFDLFFLVFLLSCFLLFYSFSIFLSFQGSTGFQPSPPLGLLHLGFSLGPAARTWQRGWPIPKRPWAPSRRERAALTSSKPRNCSRNFFRVTVGYMWAISVNQFG